MRQLRFVGPGEDRDHLVVETTDGADQFSLVVDDDLRTAVQSDLPRLFGPDPEPEPGITPREIQVRVRAGASPEAVAAEADVPLQRILVFAGPVLAERTMVTGEARRARARRSTPEGQLVEFGPTVDARFAAHRIEPSSVRWDSRRREDGQWVVSANWRDGEVERGAEWAFSMPARTVTPMDETAADLLSERPIRPVAKAVPDPPTLTGPAIPTADAEAHTMPLPVMTDEPPPDQDAGGRPGAAGPAGPRILQPDDESMPPLPLRLADPPLPSQQQPKPVPSGRVNGHGEDHNRASGKPRIPSWDDIMLGVRRKKD